MLHRSISLYEKAVILWENSHSEIKCVAICSLIPELTFLVSTSGKLTVKILFRTSFDLSSHADILRASSHVPPLLTSAETKNHFCSMAVCPLFKEINQR